MVALWWLDLSNEGESCQEYSQEMRQSSTKFEVKLIRRKLLGSKGNDTKK